MQQRTPRIAAPAEGETIRFQARHGGEEKEAFAFRFGGEVYAYINECTHRALPLDLGNGEFFTEDGKELLCRAHGARFDPSSGACVGGVCPRGSRLTAIRLREREGWLLPEGEEPPSPTQA